MILYPSYIPLFNYYSVHNVMSVLFCHACTTFSHDYSYSTWRYLYGSFNLVTFRCLCCSFCACCAFTTMAMLTWPLYLKMLALFFSELDEFLSACCRSWDESLNLMTWCGIQSLPLRWKLTTEEIVPPRLPAVSSVATGFGRSSFNSFSFNITRTVFSVLCVN